MKIRFKHTGEEGTSGRFNLHAMSEVLAYFSDWMDTMFVSDLDVHLEATGEWKDLREAFKDRDVITDNYNETFFEPRNEEERVRGYRL